MSWFKRAQEKQRLFEARQDGRLLFVGPEADCWHYIHNHSSGSVDWATKYEGWTITPKAVGDEEQRDWRDDYNWYGGEE